jgi:hypothetical protein
MNNELIEAAKAVIARWDSTDWKVAPVTAEGMNRLRAALSAKPEPCCGEYATCLRACTPRGRWLQFQSTANLPEVEECALCKGGKGFGEKYGGAIGSDPIPCPRCNETGKEPAKGRKHQICNDQMHKE